MNSSADSSNNTRMLRSVPRGTSFFPSTTGADRTRLPGTRRWSHAGASPRPSELGRIVEGETLTVAELVIRRQRPLAKAMFITLEDEFGHIPLVVWPKVYTKLRSELKAPFLVVTGTLSRRDGTLNIEVGSVEPLYVIPNPPEARNFRWCRAFNPLGPRTPTPCSPRS